MLFPVGFTRLLSKIQDRRNNFLNDKQYVFRHFSSIADVLNIIIYTTIEVLEKIRSIILDIPKDFDKFHHGGSLQSLSMESLQDFSHLASHSGRSMNVASLLKLM